MRRITFDRFPGGRFKALTLNYDDGVSEDRRLVELLNAHGMRGTFNLNSCSLDQPGHLRRDEIRGLFAGHEVAAHTASHPNLRFVPPDWMAREILDNRRDLERLVGYPVRGLAYPYGQMDDRVMSVLPSVGIAYARMTSMVPDLRMPDNFLRWQPTCRDSGDLIGCARSFTGAGPSQRGLILCVWGHTWEIERKGYWPVMEDFCALAGGRSDTWYATCLEIADYVEATRRMRCSVDGRLLHNPSSIPIHASSGSEEIVIAPGQTLDLGEERETGFSPLPPLTPQASANSHPPGAAPR